MARRRMDDVKAGDPMQVAPTSASLRCALILALCAMLAPPLSPATAPVAPATASSAGPSLFLVNWPTANAEQRRAASGAITALQAHLKAVGLTAVTVSATELPNRVGARPAVALVPWAGDAAAAAALRDFNARGGRVVLFAPGARETMEAIGVQAAGSNALAKKGPGKLLFHADALTGVPQSVSGLIPAGVPMAPQMPNRVLARWQDRGDTAAIARGSGGVVAGLQLPETPTVHSTRLVVALAASYDASLWKDAFAAVHGRVARQLNDIQQRTAALQQRVPPVSLDSKARQALLNRERRLAVLTAAPDPATALGDLLELEASIRQLWRETAPAEPGEMRAVWIHTYNPTDWDTVMRRLRDAGFNSIFVRVGRAGNVIYPSALLPRDAWAERAGGDELKRAIAAAHRYGIDFHAWRVCFHMRSAPKSFYDRMAAEDRLVRDPQGKQSFWTNPGDPRNTELELKVFAELVRRYDVDGVHFDYIRYPDDPHYDFDYGPVSRREFEKAYGVRVADWPADVIHGPLKAAYEEWERENINRLVQRVYGEVKQIRPSVKVSAAVWRNHRHYRAVIKQDWLLWAERGWVDFLVPMDYTPDMQTFEETVRAQVAAVGGRVPVVAGIGTWLQPGADEVVRQVEIARRAGASGHVLFAYNDARIQSMLDALSVGAHRQPALPADRAPAIDFRLEGPVVRKDAPHAAAIGTPIAVRAALRSQAGINAPVRVRLEDAYGVPAADLGTLDARHLSLDTRAELPAGRYQVVARGGQGAREWVVRGPLLDGLPPDEMERLRAQDEPARVEGDGVRVGIYANGLGAENLLAALSGEGRQVFLVHRLRPEHLAVAQVFILPQTRDVADLKPEAVAALRQWVEAGGRLLLTHDAVGFRWHPPLFPEIGRGTALAPRQALTAMLPGQAAWSLESSFRDYVRLAPASGATVLAREAGKGALPVIAAGGVGKGTVVLLGILPAVQGDSALTEGERRLLETLLDPGKPLVSAQNRPAP